MLNSRRIYEIRLDGEDVTKELEFRLVEEKEKEEEIFSVKIDFFVLDDAHIRTVDTVAGEPGMRLKTAFSVVKLQRNPEFCRNFIKFPSKFLKKYV